MEFETKERETSWWILLLAMAVATAGAVAVVILSKKKLNNSVNMVFIINGESYHKV